MLFIGITPLGYYVIEKFHKVNPDVGDKSRKALLVFAFYPVFDAIAFVHFGILIRYKYSLICGIASICDVGGKIVTVVIALSLDSTLNVMYIPLIAFYVGLLLRVTVIMLAYYKYIHHQIMEESGEEDVGVPVKVIIKTFLPLFISRMVQKLSRPLLNLFVARDRNGDNTEADSLKALAILSIVYPLGRVFYGFLNEVKSLEATFTGKDESGQSEATVKQVRLYIFGCFCVSVLLNVIFFWIPGITVPLVIAVANVDRALAEMCVMPCRIMSFHCFPVVLRDLTIGWLLKIKRTSGLYPGGICRIVMIVVLVNVLPLIGFHGAPMASTVLLTGFCIETAVILMSAGYIRWSRKKEALKSKEENELLAAEDDDKQFDGGETQNEIVQMSSSKEVTEL